MNIYSRRMNTLTSDKEREMNNARKDSEVGTPDNDDGDGDVSAPLLLYAISVL